MVLRGSTAEAYGTGADNTMRRERRKGCSQELIVQTILASAHRAREEGEQAAFAQLAPDVSRLFGTADGAEGMQSFIERRPAVFTGR